MEIRVTVDEVRASKSLTGQIREALCNVLCHNLCVVIQSVRELGIEANLQPMYRHTPSYQFPRFLTEEIETKVAKTTRLISAHETGGAAEFRNDLTIEQSPLAG